MLKERHWPLFAIPLLFSSSVGSISLGGRVAQAQRPGVLVESAQAGPSDSLDRLPDHGPTIRPLMSSVDCSNACDFWDMNCWYSCMWDGGGGGGGTGGTGGSGGGSVQTCYAMAAMCDTGSLECTPLSTVPGTVTTTLDGFFQSSTKCGTKSCWLGLWVCQCGSPMADIGLCQH
jgi:hypothetical protein